MNFKTKDNRNIKQDLLNLEATLNNIEVKGESVMGMFFARRALKDIFDSIEEVKEEAEGAETEGQ